MSYEGVKFVNFQTASSTGDWRFPYVLKVPGIDGWNPAVDQVVIGMTPDTVSWDDYGYRQRSFPPGSRSYEAAPFWQASSDDGTGVVKLVDPNLIDIVVPYPVMQQLGPGGVNVGLSLRNKETGARTTLLTGRLPLTWGVI